MGILNCREFPPLTHAWIISYATASCEHRFQHQSFHTCNRRNLSEAYTCLYDLTENSFEHAGREAGIRAAMMDCRRHVLPEPDVSGGSHLSGGDTELRCRVAVLLGRRSGSARGALRRQKRVRGWREEGIEKRPI